MRRPVRLSAAVKYRSMAATSTVGSGRRPAPVAPQASNPSAGGMICAPRAQRRAAFSCVTGFSHMAVFIAGAIKRGARAASTVVVSISSAIPAAALAMKFAVAGATSTSSASSASAMCSTWWCVTSAHIVAATGCPVTSRNVRGATKDAAARVMMTCTSAPAFFRRLAISTAL